MIRVPSRPIRKAVALADRTRRRIGSVERPAVVRIGAAPNWAALRFGVPEERFEMRVLRDVLGCEHVGVSWLRLGPSWRSTVGHRHPAGEEVYVLVEGRARMKIDEEIVEMEAPSAVRVGGEQLRAIRPVQDEGAVFVVVGYPIDDPDATEIIRDFWPTDG
jgi:mannose-6-phosphate isomerase-like protein (cupin superfamily)